MDREVEGKRFREEVKQRGVTPEEMQTLWKALGVRKATMLGMKIYNSACTNCKRAMLSNSKMAMSEYCLTCQDMIKREFEAYL